MVDVTANLPICQRVSLPGHFNVPMVLETARPRAESVTEATTGARSQQFTYEHGTAKFKISTVVTRAGKKKPTCELVDLDPLTSAPPAPRDQK